HESDAFGIQTPSATPQTAGQRLRMRQDVRVIRLITGEGAAINGEHVGIGVPDDDLILGHRSGPEVRRNGDSQLLNPWMIVLQAVPKTTIRQSEDRDVN